MISTRKGTFGAYAGALALTLGLGFSAAAVARTMVAGRPVLVQPGEAVNCAGSRCFSLMAGAGFDEAVEGGAEKAAAIGSGHGRHPS